MFPPPHTHLLSHPHRSRPYTLPSCTSVWLRRSRRCCPHTWLSIRWGILRRPLKRESMGHANPSPFFSRSPRAVVKKNDWTLVDRWPNSKTAANADWAGQGEGVLYAPCSSTKFYCFCVCVCLFVVFFPTKGLWVEMFLLLNSAYSMTAINPLNSNYWSLEFILLKIVVVDVG